MKDSGLKASILLAAVSIAALMPDRDGVAQSFQGVRPCSALAGASGETEKHTVSIIPPTGPVEIASGHVAPAGAASMPILLFTPPPGGPAGAWIGKLALDAITDRNWISMVGPPREKALGDGVARMVSRGRNGEPANGVSCLPRYSADGRTVLYATEASNVDVSLAAAAPDKQDQSFQQVVFCGSRIGRVCIYISRNLSTGQLGNGDSTNVRVAPDGRSGVFESLASNLVEGDTNGVKDVFRFELDNFRLVRLERVSVSKVGMEGNGPSYNASISDDGGTVTFESSATNLVAAGANAVSRTLVKFHPSGALVHLQTSDDRPPDGVISETAGFASGVVIASDASNLAVDGFASPFIGPKNTLRPRQAIYVVSERRGRYVSKNPATGQLGNGDSFNLAVTPDGRYGVFESLASNLVPGDTNGLSDIFRFEMVDGEVVGMLRVSTTASGIEANGHSRNPGISTDGQTIVFESDASNLVAGDSNNVADVMVRVMPTGAIARLPRGLNGAEANGASGQPEISPDGLTIAFASRASNLVVDDSNGLQDVFSVSQLSAGPTDEPGLSRLVLPTPNPANANCPSGFFSAVVDDGPGTGLTPGAFGMEVLLDEPGTRVLAGGLNFGGLIDAGQVGFAGFTIANAANENQRLNLSLTGSPSTGSGQSLPVRIRIARRTATSSETVFESTQTISLASPYVTGIDLPPAFYEATVAPVNGSAGGSPEGQFFFSLTTNFINRPGGGFQGGAVVGGYHATHPFGGVSGFAAFCLATPHATSIRVLSQPSYGSTGARDLRLRIQDAQQRDVVVVPAG